MSAQNEEASRSPVLTTKRTDDGINCKNTVLGSNDKPKGKGQTAQILKQVIDFLRAMHDKHEDTDDDESHDYFDFGTARKDDKTAQAAATKEPSHGDQQEQGSSTDVSTSTGSSQVAGPTRFWSEHAFKSESAADVWKTNIEQAIELQRASLPRRASFDVEHAAQALLQAMNDSSSTQGAATVEAPPRISPQSSSNEHTTSAGPSANAQSPLEANTVGFARHARAMTFSEYLQQPTGMAWLRDLQKLGNEQTPKTPMMEILGKRKRTATIESVLPLTVPPSVGLDAADDASMPPPPPLSNASAPSSTTSHSSTSDDVFPPQAGDHGDFKPSGFSFAGPDEDPGSVMTFDDIMARMQGPLVEGGLHAPPPPPESTKSLDDIALPIADDLGLHSSTPATAHIRDSHARSQSLSVPDTRSPMCAATSASAPPALCTSPIPLGQVGLERSPAGSSASQLRTEDLGNEVPQKASQAATKLPAAKKRGQTTSPTSNSNQKGKTAEKATLKPPPVDPKKVVVERRKRRRESHNAVERRRRDLINERIAEMAALLPQPLLLEAIASSTGGGTAPHIDLSILTQQCTCHDALPQFGGTNGCTGGCRQHDDAIAELAQAKPNKGVVLTKSVEYIKHLHEICATLRRSNGELQQQLDSIRQTLLGNAGGAGQSAGLLGNNCPFTAGK